MVIKKAKNAVQAECDRLYQDVNTADGDKGQKINCVVIQYCLGNI